MISVYNVKNGQLQLLDCSNEGTGLSEATWVDMLDYTKDQELAVESLFQIDIPTREEVRAIDASSQIRHDNGSLFMTARVVSRNEESGLRWCRLVGQFRGSDKLFPVDLHAALRASAAGAGAGACPGTSAGSGRA